MKALAIVMLLASCADERVLSGACTSDCTVDVHAPGILDPTSLNFHAAVLRGERFDLGLCASCHGADFSGGVAKASCLGCHAPGPTACATCHGEGALDAPRGAHGFHVAAGVACAECHVGPATWDGGAHTQIPVAVTFGALASLRAAPRWDGATCTNTYCHGTGAPRWDAPAPAPAALCASCHGDPPIGHVRADCGSCHPPDAPHVDGIVQVGTGCDGCHGSPGSPAPPRDLAGNTFTTALGVGAHRAHLQGTSRIAAPIPCATCHLVPASIDAVGHIDTPAPAEVAVALGWDRVAQTCSSASCHGDARPVWTSHGQVSCGTCHGLPPSDAPHTAAMTLASCATCHPGTVDAFGNIIVTNGTSEHINGRVDLQ